MADFKDKKAHQKVLACWYNLLRDHFDDGEYIIADMTTQLLLVNALVFHSMKFENIFDIKNLKN